MFTLNEIKEAHAKVKSGADFPAYIKALIKLGVTGYSTYVSDGHTEFAGKGNYSVQSDAKYEAIAVADVSNKEKFKHYLKIHQQGETTYPAFCNHSAETGVEKWTVDTRDMTCTYYSKLGEKMLLEKIPAV